MSDLPAHDGATDPVHQQLRKSIEKREKSYLWTPATMITFTPYLLPIYYGDWRLTSSINQMPSQAQSCHSQQRMGYH